MNHKYTKELLDPLVKKSTSFRQVLLHLGLNPLGGSHFHITKVIKRLAIDTTHFVSQAHNKGKVLSKLTKEDILKQLTIKDAMHMRQSHSLKLLLYKFGLKNEVCEECGMLPIWNGKKISFHLDHKNGNRLDDRLENLRILCPNCHSQTATFSKRKLENKQDKVHSIIVKLCSGCGVTIGKRSKSGLCSKCAGKLQSKICDKDTLIALLKNNSCSSIGRRFGVSGTTIKRWVYSYDLEKVFGRGEFAKHVAKQLPKKEDLEEAIQNGVTLNDMAKKYGVCYYTVSTWLKRWGLTPLSQSDRTRFAWKKGILKKRILA